MREREGLGAEEASGTEVWGEGQMCGEQSGEENVKQAGQRGPVPPSHPLPPPTAGTGARGLDAILSSLLGRRFTSNPELSGSRERGHHSAFTYCIPENSSGSC